MGIGLKEGARAVNPAEREKTALLPWMTLQGRVGVLVETPKIATIWCLTPFATLTGAALNNQWFSKSPYGWSSPWCCSPCSNSLTRVVWRCRSHGLFGVSGRGAQQPHQERNHPGGQGGTEIRHHPG